MIFPLYKPLGQSAHLLAQAAGKRRGEKATHTGTLDPMAEGVLLVLTGEDRFKKGSLSEYAKIYEFAALLGVSTDSNDLLGLVTAVEKGGFSLDEVKLRAAAQTFAGRQQQRLPDFSAKRSGGESYFDLAKAGRKPPAAYEEIEIYSLELAKLKKISAQQLKQALTQKIKLVEGDFRQLEILDRWQQFFLQDAPESFWLASFTAQVSKRTYIRALVRDLGAKLGIPTTTFSLVRTANGPYTIADCLCLI